MAPGRFDGPRLTAGSRRSSAQFATLNPNTGALLPHAEEATTAALPVDTRSPEVPGLILRSAGRLPRCLPCRHHL